MSRIRFALAQLNPIVGDLTGNSRLIIDAVRIAVDAGAAVIVTPEMSVTGYPVDDLAHSASFIRDSEHAVTALARELDNCGFGDKAVVVGYLALAEKPEFGGIIAHNSLAVLHGGAIAARYNKRHLPNYSVFDEERTFVPGSGTLILSLGGVTTGFLICEDLWRFDGPVHDLARHDLDAVVVLNASPFDSAKDEMRFPLLETRARELRAPIVYVNSVGGQDDLVFDGDSAVVDAEGRVVQRSPRFVSDLSVVDLIGRGDAQTGIALAEPTHTVTPSIAKDHDDYEAIWSALVLGVRDFINKNGFPSVTLGLSGGIDSAVCAALAVDALGADRVYGVAMPSRYSSDHSLDDAAALATTLGLHYLVHPIDELVTPFESELSLSGLAAENVQARIRGVILMSLSNTNGHLVLTTGNKTEIAVGYCTMYGDTVGGYAPLKDVPKTLVWKLARWRNDAAKAHGNIAPIPENSITKPPSAELRPDQTDQDSLPPYEVLDAILELLVDHRASVTETVAQGFDADTVHRVAGLVAGSEWKRRQGAIGPRITRMAFGRERRLPITVRHSAGLG